MAIATYLAMTSEEFDKESPISFPMAWMTPCSSALWTNPPAPLPTGSLLAVTDQFPINRVDFSLLCGTLSEIVFRFGCQGVVLDFQHPGNRETLAFARQLIDALPCPVAVSDCYARELDCPVFLSPVPLDCRLQTHIAPWKDREIWLDFSTEGMEILLTKDGSTPTPLPHFVPNMPGHSEKILHSHYSIAVEKTSATFTLWRTKEDLRELLQEAENLGIAKAIGLYQELGSL